MHPLIEREVKSSSDPFRGEVDGPFEDFGEFSCCSLTDWKCKETRQKKVRDNDDDAKVFAVKNERRNEPKEHHHRSQLCS